MTEPRSEGAMLRGLREAEREAEYELAFFTESARTYWRMWGPFGEPMVRTLNSWSDVQRDYFRRVGAATRDQHPWRVAPPVLKQGG
jgi:hypothetical protein